MLCRFRASSGNWLAFAGMASKACTVQFVVGLQRSPSRISASLSSVPPSGPYFPAPTSITTGASIFPPAWASKCMCFVSHFRPLDPPTLKPCVRSTMKR